MRPKNTRPNPISEFRKARKLTLAEAAKVLNCSPALVSHIEQSRRAISPEYAERWESILGIPKELLVFSVEVKQEGARA